MKPIVIGAAACAALLGGGYAYVSHTVDRQIEETLQSINADEDLGFEIAYGSMDTSLMSGTITLRDVTATNREDKSKQIKLEAIEADLDIWNMDDPASLEGAALQGISLNKDGVGFHLDRVAVSGLDMPALIAMKDGAPPQALPLTFFEVKGLEVTSPQTGIDKFAIDTIRFETSEDKQTLKQAMYKGLAMKSSMQQVDFELGKFEIQGGDLGIFEDIMRLAASEKGGAPLADDDIDKIANSMADMALGYMGIESIEISDLNVSAPNGFAMSLDEFSVKDIVRHQGLVVGMRYMIKDFSIPNLMGLSPQADQVFEIADHKSLLLNVKADSRFDPKEQRMVGTSDIKIDDLLHLASTGNIHDVNLDKMVAGMRLMFVEQYRQMLQQIATGEPPAPLTPEEQIAQMMDMLGKAYTGYYSTVEFALSVEDLGFNEKGLKVYSAMSGMQVEQLRQQLAMAFTMNLSQLLGSSTPENLPQTMTAYLASPSTPFEFGMKNSVPLTEEALSGMTPENWHELFEFTLKP